MNEPSKKLDSLLRYGIAAVAILAGVKILWLLTEVLWLPVEGVEQRPLPRSEYTLHYSLGLASDAARPTPPPRRPRKPLSSIRDLLLLATYLDGARPLAVIGKGKNFRVVGIGERAFGYRVEQIGTKEVTLERGGKAYRLRLKEPAVNLPAIVPVSPPPPGTPRSESSAKIRTLGATTIVPRSLLNTYLQKMDKIWKDIGLVPEKAGGELKGFRVRFVRRGSPFDQMGIRRGDLLTAIDGEPLDNNAILLKSVRKIRNSDHLALRIKRGNKEVELKYDIR